MIDMRCVTHFGPQWNECNDLKTNFSLPVNGEDGNQLLDPVILGCGSLCHSQSCHTPKHNNPSCVALYGLQVRTMIMVSLPSSIRILLKNETITRLRDVPRIFFTVRVIALSIQWMRTLFCHIHGQSFSLCSLRSANVLCIHLSKLAVQCVKDLLGG